MGDLTVVHVCYGWESCDVSIVDGADALGIDEPSLRHGHAFSLVKGQARLVVLRIAPDLVLIKASVRRTYAFPAEEVSNIVFRRVETRWRGERFQIEWIIQRTNTPLAWIDFGLAGVGLMLVLWAVRVLIPLAHRRARARAQSGKSVGRLVSAYRLLVAESGNELVIAEYNLVRLDAAIVALTCVTASPLVTAAMTGLLR